MNHHIDPSAAVNLWQFSAALVAQFLFCSSSDSMFVGVKKVAQLPVPRLTMAVSIGPE